jgi:uncharacterized metal-binding protein YceD (DUF177 family)
MTPGSRVVVDLVGAKPREVVVAPDAAGRAALAARLHLNGLPALTCQWVLTRDGGGRVLGRGMLRAAVVQEDVTTLEPFEQEVREDFTIRFVPAEELDDEIDPDDPVDEIGYEGGTIDLHEATCEQLALCLDPYPRAPGAETLAQP